MQGLIPWEAAQFEVYWRRGLALGIVAGFFVAGFDRNRPRDLIKSFFGQRPQTNCLEQERSSKAFLHLSLDDDSSEVCYRCSTLRNPDIGMLPCFIYRGRNDAFPV